MVKPWSIRTIEERPISVDEVVTAFSKGELKEVFGTGTAATIAQISAIGYKENELVLPAASERKVANMLAHLLENIKHADAPDRYNWITKVVKVKSESVA